MWSVSFAKYSMVHTNFDQSSRVTFSYAQNYPEVPSSEFFKTNLSVWFIFAAHFNLLKNWSIFSFTTFAMRLQVAKINDLYLAILGSDSTTKWWRDRNSFSGLYHQSCWLCSQNQILVSAIECLYVIIKGKLLENLCEKSVHLKVTSDLGALRCSTKW